ncbi:hypothetical protein [Nocardioides speluncae]|uniref:hypothetical protein n=1 Tax=Nocardioides speluncae TaxID=2670337 RepID=UPI0012B17E2F|nr:hypothetical protein [Nocardioides speluncae]
MTFDTELSGRLRELTDDVEGGPSLASAIQTGRARRRTRRLAWAGGAAAAVLGLTGTGVAVLGQGGGEGGGEGEVAVASDPPADGGGFVPTSGVDELIQGVVARYVNYQPRDIYPSDWTRKTPLPDDQAQNATDWQAYYDLPDAQELAVVLGLPVPYEDPWTGCQAGDTTCTEGTFPDGRTWTRTRFESGEEHYRMVTVGDDKRRVNVWITIPTASTGNPVISDAQLLEIASDAELTFPNPEVTPPPTPPPGVEP